MVPKSYIHVNRYRKVKERIDVSSGPAWRMAFGIAILGSGA